MNSRHSAPRIGLVTTWMVGALFGMVSRLGQATAPVAGQTTAPVASKALVEFKGLRLGAPRAALLSHELSWQCFTVKGNQSTDFVCEARPGCTKAYKPDEQVTSDCTVNAPNTFAGVSIREVTSSGKNERVTFLSFVADGNFFNLISEALIAQYGPPATREKLIWEGQQGSRLDNTRLTWRQPNGGIELKARSNISSELSVSMHVPFEPKDSATKNKKTK